MLKLIKTRFGLSRKHEWEEGSSNTANSPVTNDPPKHPKEKILIVGAGMSGTTSAYFLAKQNRYDITVIDKDFPIKGATEQNANTMTFVPYPAWTTINYWNVLKDNIMRKENPQSFFKFSLLFDSHFRFWLRHYMKNRKPAEVERSNRALARLISYSLSLYDGYIDETTEGNPNSVDYHKEEFTNICKGLTEKEVKAKEDLLEIIKQYDDSVVRVEGEELAKYGNPSFSYRIGIRTLNTARFWDFMKNKLESKMGVEFIQGKVNGVTYTDESIKGIEYVDNQQKSHKLEGYDKYVFCGGIESIHLGQLVGLKVPLLAFKGHSLNMYMDKKDMPDNTYNFHPENVAITRIGLNSTGMMRVTGFADVDGTNLDPIDARKQQLIKVAKDFLGEKYYDESKASHWVGLRPVCADDVPLIGKSSKFNNLYWNTGHGARGITLSPGSATILTSVISGQPLSSKVSEKDYLPGRFDI